MKKLRTTATNLGLIILLYSTTALVLYFAWSRTFTPTSELSFLRWGILILFAPILFKYFLHLFVASWYPLIEFVRLRNQYGSFTTRVSVLIPAHNEEVGIRSTINSVVNTRYPNLEIIVINDGSTDRTYDVVTRCIASHRRRQHTSRMLFRYRRVTAGGKSRALNIALALAHPMCPMSSPIP